MSSAPKLPPAGTQLAPLLLPFLAVVVLGGVAMTGHLSDPPAPMGGNDALTDSLYSPEAFTPRFTSVWAMLLRAQYGAVTRYSAAFRVSSRPSEKARAEAEYRVCLHEYDRLAALVPAGAFAGQRLPHYIPETALPYRDGNGTV
jgi:hypothetical protein